MKALVNLVPSICWRLWKIPCSLWVSPSVWQQNFLNILSKSKKRKLKNSNPSCLLYLGSVSRRIHLCFKNNPDYQVIIWVSANYYWNLVSQPFPQSPGGAQLPSVFQFRVSSAAFRRRSIFCSSFSTNGNSTSSSIFITLLYQFAINSKCATSCR